MLVFLYYLKLKPECRTLVKLTLNSVAGAVEIEYIFND